MLPVLESESFNCNSQDVIHFIECISEEQLVVLDFDETLLLRNSTEEYLDTIRPQILGYIFLRVLDRLKPWQWMTPPLRGQGIRDWFRVFLATFLFPATFFLWNNRAQHLAKENSNQALIEAINRNPYVRVVIATRGFEFIVKPIAKHLPIKIEKVIGCRFFAGASDRHKGKEELVEHVIQMNDIQQAVLITDSIDDESLLSLVKVPFLVQWADSKYTHALADIYLPFFYMEHVKRPGQKFTWRVVVKNHFASIVLALTLLSTAPVLQVIGLICLVASFWCVYEIGYFENDQIAEKYERTPVLSETYHRYKSRMDVYQPWLYASLMAVPGVVFIQLSDSLIWKFPIFGQLAVNTAIGSFDLGETGLGLAIWMGMLVLTRLTYSSYNYLDERTRIWIYPVLQFSKYFGFPLLVAANALGMALLAAQVFVDWIPYLVYRCGGKRDLVDEQILRLFVFLLLCSLIAIAQQDVSLFQTWQFGIMLIWCTARSISQIKSIVKNAHFIFQAN